MIKNKLIDIFSQIPFEAWNNIIKQEPEWIYLGNLKNQFIQGTFALIMLTAGLNAYRLKHNAQKTYFPNLYDHFKSLNNLNYENLKKSFLGFYEKELAYKNKLKRINKLYDSDLAKYIYNSNIEVISKDIKNIWQELACVMDSKPCQKTIAFAMKCLAESFIMYGIYDFEFDDVIPVDSRIKTFSQTIGLDNLKDQYIIDFFKDFIKSLKQKLPFMNMIYLDSLIWQIAKLDKEELINYFKDLNLENLAHDLISIIYA